MEGHCLQIPRQRQVPMTCTILPFFISSSLLRFHLLFSLSLLRFAHPPHDLGDLLCDRRLPHPVVLDRQHHVSCAFALSVAACIAIILELCSLAIRLYQRTVDISGHIVRNYMHPASTSMDGFTQIILLVHIRPESGCREVFASSSGSSFHLLRLHLKQQFSIFV